MKVEQITFSGGEPMLHPGFWEAVDRAVWHGFKIRIFSNLTLLNTSDAKRLAELKAKNIHEIQTSLYSMDPAIHDAVTQSPGSWKKTKDAVLSLVQNGIPVHIACPLMKQNKDSYTGVLKWAQSLNLSSTPVDVIMARSDHTADNLANRLDLEDIAALVRDILVNDTAYDRERFDLDYVPPEEDGEEPANATCVDFLALAANGDLYPGPSWHDVLGNLNEQSLADVWENSPRVKALRALRKKDFPKCLACRDKNFCSPCWDVHVNENPAGDPRIINEFVCQAAALTKEIVHDWKRRNHAVPAKV
jgi:radical SAM protein with 4Fe4S-binding SPASM domain